MNDLDPEVPEIPISWHKPDLVRDTIFRMKSYKAPGIDGWRAQELKLLPFQAIEDLTQILVQIWDAHFTPNQMLARTILLAKVMTPDTFSDGRPITILGYLPRLTSKLIADQLLSQWGRTWDPKIAGGLPFRAVKDSATQQQFLIEKVRQNNIPYVGFTLDLVKAFNLIPRQIARRLLIAWGAPPIVFKQHVSHASNPKPLQPGSTCHHRCPGRGCNVGLCDASHCSIFFRKVSIIQVTPFTYADNWTFMSNDQRLLFRALIATLNFAHSIKMKIDIQKSWGWGTNDEMRKFWKTANLLFPAQDVNIEIKRASKDLGCMMQYSRRTFLGCLKSRMQSAKRRLLRLQKLDLSIADKASKIQTAIWPVAFYGAESQVIGDSHFVQLRRSATDA